MNKKLLILIGIVAVIVIVAIVMITGRPKGPGVTPKEQPAPVTEVTPGEEQVGIELTPEEIFREAREVPPTDHPLAKIETLDAKSVLSEVFGGAKLTTSFLDRETGLTAEYTLKRTVTAEDIDPLVKVFKEKGYTIQSSGVLGDSLALTVEKRIEAEKVMLHMGLSGSLGEQKIEMWGRKYTIED